MKPTLILILLFLSSIVSAQSPSHYAILPSKEGNAIMWLKKEELKAIDSLFYAAVNTFNREHTSKNDSISFIKNPQSYYRQYLPFYQNGQRMVMVNCFCGDAKRFPYWRKEQVIVNDGGRCYFMFIVNLDEKTFSDFHTNGLG